MGDQRVEEIRERLKALGYPAWAWEPFGEKSNNFIVGVAYDGGDEIISGRMPEGDEDAIRIESVCEKHDAVGYQDAEFIAHAPSDIAYLLERLEAAEAVVEVAEEILHHEDATSEHVFEKDYIERYRKAFDRLRTALESYREVAGE